MKYKLYVNQEKMNILALIIGAVLMATHKFTGFGFAGFSVFLIATIDVIEVTSLNKK